MDRQGKLLISKEMEQLHCSILLEEVKEKVQKLKDFGLSEKEISSLLHSEQPLIKLIVDGNYRIYLGASRKEVRMEPIVKAVYLLFLKKYQKELL